MARPTLRWLAQERPARWGRYHPVALDDTTRHRTSAKVWGTCPLHEARARSPNRAETGRAHHWVGRGDLRPGTPWTSLPHAARLYGRQTQRPTGETFHTQTAWAVELWRQAAAEANAPLVGGLAGAYAVETGVAPWVHPAPGQRRMALLTRLRVEARRSQPVVGRAQRQGRRPTGGERMAAPQHQGYWSAAWRTGRAWV